MARFDVPNSQRLLFIANGIASMAAQVKLIAELPEGEAKLNLITEISEKGEPQDYFSVGLMMAKTMIEEELGWFKRNMFMRRTGGFLVGAGFSQSEARIFLDQVNKIYWDLKDMG
jgi:hypothetical protein